MACRLNAVKPPKKKMAWIFAAGSREMISCLGASFFLKNYHSLCLEITALLKELLTPVQERFEMSTRIDNFCIKYDFFKLKAISKFLRTSFPDLEMFPDFQCFTLLKLHCLNKL